jgi:putative membrane protein
MLALLATPSWRRLLVGDEVLERRVRARAAQAFLDEELYATRDRTGLLLFVALFEHRVEILCDEGVRKVVPEGVWQEVADELARGLRTHQAGPALVAAVERCGILLESHGVERRADDADELSNRPRILDE